MSHPGDLTGTFSGQGQAPLRTLAGMNDEPITQVYVGTLILPLTGAQTTAYDAARTRGEVLGTMTVENILTVVTTSFDVVRLGTDEAGTVDATRGLILTGDAPESELEVFCDESGLRVLSTEVIRLTGLPERVYFQEADAAELKSHVLAKHAENERLQPFMDDAGYLHMPPVDHTPAEYPDGITAAFRQAGIPLGIHATWLTSGTLQAYALVYQENGLYDDPADDPAEQPLALNEIIDLDEICEDLFPPELAEIILTEAFRSR